jgi:hypothetical protein
LLGSSRASSDTGSRGKCRKVPASSSSRKAIVAGAGVAAVREGYLQPLLLPCPWQLPQQLVLAQPAMAGQQLPAVMLDPVHAGLTC